MIESKIMLSKTFLTNKFHGSNHTSLTKTVIRFKIKSDMESGSEKCQKVRRIIRMAPFVLFCGK